MDAGLVTVILVLLGVFIYKKCVRVLSYYKRKFYNYWCNCLQQNFSSDLPSGSSEEWLSGEVVSVSDGDGFRVVQTPLFGSIKYKRGDESLSIRLAGIDAPETAHFGNPAQPFSAEAKQALKELILHKTVELKLIRKDRYNRILATCYVEDLFGIINVNKKMVELGMACVYHGSDAVYDDYKDDLLRLEAKARQRKIGMWSQKNYVSPMQYKKNLRDRSKRDRNNDQCVIM